MVSTRRLDMDFTPGECVLCFEPDLSKARVLYDAKVLDIVTTKDSKGRTKTEYMVHFQGWNSSWDRVVPENYVIKNSDRNRSLMRRLAEIARHVKRNKARMRRIDNILKQHFKKRPKFDSDTSSGETSSTEGEELSDEDNADDEGDDSMDTDQGEENTFTSSMSRNGLHRDYHSEEETDKAEPELEDSEPKEVELDLPGNLKRKLEYDCVAINREERLVQLPAEPNIINILESYVKNFGVNVLCATVEKQKPYTLREPQADAPEKNIDLCKEVMDGLRVFFDFALPSILLYDGEREQYKKLASSTKPLVHIKSEPQDNKPTLQSLSNARCHDRDLGEPPSKHSRVSQRVCKQEEDDYSDNEGGPPRRITRKAFAEELRRSSLKSAESPKVNATGQENVEANQTPTAKRGRGATCPTTDTKKSETKCSGRRGRTISEKSSHSTKASKSESHQRASTLPEPVSPPPPLLLAGSMSSASSNVDTPTSSMMEQSLFRHRENAVNEIFSWKMLPEQEYKRVPTPPSLLYGAQHLLRLFVCLPNYIGRMPFPASRLQHLVKHLELFIEHLSTRANELFPETAYIDKSENGED